jgi:hypothetical protein
VIRITFGKAPRLETSSLYLSFNPRQNTPRTETCPSGITAIRNPKNRTRRRDKKKVKRTNKRCRTHVKTPLAIQNLDIQVPPT